ncbi:MAG TPA: flavodoxin domain-containing protein [Syntrophorhabdales bacterium]|nr:flavodoxin domain-containing protein [Syntrophorhabdales bacterium]
MKKVLLAYDSETGKTKQMAEYIAEGIRISGHDADVKRLNEIKSERELEGYDAYLFGSPTHNLDMTDTMKTFLSVARNVNLYGKVGGAFGSYTFSGDAPKIIFDIMESRFRMDMVNLGSLNLLEELLGKGEDMRACRDYGKAIGEKLGA